VKPRIFLADPLVRLRNTSRRGSLFIKRRPLAAFLVLLGLLLALIVISNLWPQPQPAEIVQTQTKKVEVYQIGTAPKIRVQAQIKKTGVITINALTSGVISQIHQVEGNRLVPGSSLVSIASNYQGGNISSVQRQIAQQQYKQTLETYPIQKELITKQREVAQKTDENNDQLRDIAGKSLQETRDLISLNENILGTIDTNLSTLEQDPTSNAALILSTKQLKSQFLSATSQARNALRNTEYQADPNKPQASLSDISRDITLKQLEMQDKQLEIGKELSRLQVVLAQVSESMYYPTSPFNGVVERVLVKPNEAVSPGTPLMVISQDVWDDPVSAIAYVSHDIASRVSVVEPSILYLGTTPISVTPYYVSTEAVQGQLYAVYYPIAEDMNKAVSDKEYIRVEIPLGLPDTSAAIPFVPLDVVYQSQNRSYLFVVDGDTARSREVTLGQVMGRFVEVESGLHLGDQIIVNRTVIEGEKVEVDPLQTK
jgi:hypothetical protein